jgi:hypothetical protein
MTAFMLDIDISSYIIKGRPERRYAVTIAPVL